MHNLYSNKIYTKYLAWLLVITISISYIPAKGDLFSNDNLGTNPQTRLLSWLIASDIEVIDAKTALELIENGADPNVRKRQRRKPF